MRWTCGSSWWWIDSSPGESGLAPKRDSDVLLPRERGTLPETRSAPDHHVTRAPLARLKGIDPSLDMTASAGGAQVGGRTYIGDARPGQILCQDVAEFGGTWLIVSPRGLAVR